MYLPTHAYVHSFCDSLVLLLLLQYMYVKQCLLWLHVMAWPPNTFVHKNENVFFCLVEARQYVSPFVCNM